MRTYLASVYPLFHGWNSCPPSTSRDHPYTTCVCYAMSFAALLWILYPINCTVQTLYFAQKHKLVTMFNFLRVYNHWSCNEAWTTVLLACQQVTTQSRQGTASVCMWATVTWKCRTDSRHLGIIVIIMKSMQRPCLIFLLVWSGHSKTSAVFSEDINYPVVGDV